MPALIQTHTKETSSEAAETYARRTFDKMNTSKAQKRTFELDPFRTVIYKKGKIMGGRYFVLELSFNEEKFYISSFDIETSDQAFLCISD